MLSRRPIACEWSLKKPSNSDDSQPYKHPPGGLCCLFVAEVLQVLNTNAIRITTLCPGCIWQNLPGASLGKVQKRELPPSTSPQGRFTSSVMRYLGHDQNR